MVKLLADHDVKGQVGRLFAILDRDPWREFWRYLDVSIETFDSLGLLPCDSDTAVWRACQRNGVVLLTGNRNRESEDSLGATLERELLAESLPVLTFGDADQLLNDAAYAQRVAERLLEYLFQIDDLRGVGRLYLP